MSTDVSVVRNSNDIIPTTQKDLEFIEEIVQCFHHRKYSQASNLISERLETGNWTELALLLKKLPFRQLKSHYGHHLWRYRKHSVEVKGVAPLSSGKLRDGVLAILGLEGATGMDVDLLKVFGRRFRVRDITELKRRAARKARRELREQISRGNTFFIDTSNMHPLGALVPMVKRIRAEEFLAMGDRPHMNTAVRTYYGFAHLTGCLTVEDRNELSRLCGGLPNFTGERISSKYHQFKNCSQGLEDLLTAYIKTTMAKPQTQVKGIREIGVAGDSRGLGALHTALKMESQYKGSVDLMNSVRYETIKALGEIGHPSSVEHLQRFVGKFTFDQRVMSALACIKHPNALEILIHRAFNEPPDRIKRGKKGRTSEMDLCTRAEAIHHMDRFQSERAVEALVDLLEDSDVGDLALSVLRNMGDLGARVIDENEISVQQAEELESKRGARWRKKHKWFFNPDLKDVAESYKECSIKYDTKIQ